MAKNEYVMQFVCLKCLVLEPICVAHKSKLFFFLNEGYNFCKMTWIKVKVGDEIYVGFPHPLG